MTIEIKLDDAYAKCVTAKFGSVESLFCKVVCDCVDEVKREEAAAKMPQPELADGSLIEISVKE